MTSFKNTSSGWGLATERSIVAIKHWELSSTKIMPTEQEDIFGQSWTKKRTGSTSILDPDPGYPSVDTELFTPELVVNSAEDRNTEEYRFLCPHAGHYKCKLTDLVFEMEGESVVLYRIVPWDCRVLDGLGQMEPAGPLYSIDCLSGSVRHLYLPHCETRKDKVKMTVAHVSGGKVEIVQPLTVKNTHVTIKIHRLSCFGLTVRWNRSSIRAQVLLFYKTVPEHSIGKLHIHLLPANVSVKEVQKQHETYTYIETAANCDLTPGTKYRSRCKSTDCDYTPKPEVVKFHRDYGPNYHPTFEVALNIEAAKVTLILLDKSGKEVWTPPEIFLTGTGVVSPRMDTPGFVDQHRERLIQRFVAVMEVADCLKGKEMITDEMYSKIQAKPTPQDKMRELYTCLDSAGRAAKEQFYEILEKKHSLLLKDLS